jgi:septal ring factor EnvC (AmiA/AmiB activator)
VRTEAGVTAASGQHQALATELASLVPARATATTGLAEARQALAETTRTIESRRAGLASAEAELSTAQQALQEVEAKHARLPSVLSVKSSLEVP